MPVQPRPDRTFIIAGTLVVALLVILGIYTASSYFGSDRDVTFAVKDKQRVCSSSSNGSSSCKYLIYTSAGTFENTDSITSGKFNSSDVFGDITIGHTYKAHVRGWRSGFLSMYPNILSINEVK